MPFGREKKSLGIVILFFISLIFHGAVGRGPGLQATPSSQFTQWINRLYRPQISPQNWISFDGEGLLGDPAAQLGRASYQVAQAQVPRPTVIQPPRHDVQRDLDVNLNFQYPPGVDFRQYLSPYENGGLGSQSVESLRELRVPGLLENVEGAGGSGGSFGSGNEASFGGSSVSPSPPRIIPPPLPDIVIGSPPPFNQFGPYRIQDNFQQSFQVLLMPECNWATQSYQNDQVGGKFSDNIGSGGNEGSIITANRIYFSPSTPYPRSQPFRKNKPLPPLRRPHRVISEHIQTRNLLHNISSVVQDRFVGVANADKTIAVIHLQSYSSMSVDRDRIKNDSDLIEAQENFGFPGNNFQFGSTHTIVSVFKKLLNTNFDGFQGSSTAQGEDNSGSMNRITNFINATQKIHFWAHDQGEEDATRLFKFTTRVNNDTTPTFIDTAPVTVTLSAVVF